MNRKKILTGIIFVYPLHGGFMGTSAKTLFFGKDRNYGALSPEFETYETIWELEFII